MSQRIRVATLLLVVALGACSSGGHSASTTSTTLSATAPPSAATKAAVQAYLAHKGAKLIAFAKAAAPLDTGLAPALASCTHLAHVVLPKIGSPNELSMLAVGIPDSFLAAHFRTEVFLKTGMVEACIQKQVTPGMVDNSFDNTAALRTRLALFGIKI